MRQIRIGKKHQRDQHPPHNHRPRKVYGRQPRTDDVTNPHQCRRSQRRSPGHAPGMRHRADAYLVRVKVVDHGARKLQKSTERFAKKQEAPAVGEKLQHRAQGHRAENITRSFGGAVLSGLDDFCACPGFRPRQIGFHAKGPAQYNNKENPQQPSGKHQDNRFPQVITEIHPDVLAAGLRHEKSGQCEGHSSHQSFAYRCRRTRNVLLQNASAKKRQPENRDGDHRGGNRGGDGLARLHRQIGVGGSENRRQKHPQKNSFKTQLGLARACRDEGLKLFNPVDWQIAHDLPDVMAPSCDATLRRVVNNCRLRSVGSNTEARRAEGNNRVSAFYPFC